MAQCVDIPSASGLVLTALRNICLLWCDFVVLSIQIIKASK